MIKLISVAVLSLAALAAGGGTIGLLTAKPKTFSDNQYGTVPAHLCIVEQGHYCGMFFDASLGMVEISRNSVRSRNKLIRSRQDGGLSWSREPVPPTRLTEPQVEAASASSAALQFEAGMERATSGAIVGTQIWLFVAVAVLIAYLILFLFHRIRPYGSTVGRSARNLGQSALSAGQSAQSISRSLGETAALHIQVHKSELLARKAVAEAKLKRQDPDVDKHQVEIRANLRG